MSSVYKIKDQMKIGVLTWGRNYNYGGFLQAFALIFFLRGLWHDVELVNYGKRQSLPQKYFNISRFVPRRHSDIKAVLRELVSFVCPTLFNCEVERRLRRSAALMRKCCIPMGEEIEDNRMLSDYLGENFDCVVVGSDQIWNPDWIDDGAYLLSGCGEIPRRISYAASMGRMEIPAEKQDLYIGALKKFSAISVREHSAVLALNALPGMTKDIEWVVDPTLFYDQERWRGLLKLKKRKECPVIVCYWLASKVGLAEKLHRLAIEMGCKVHLYMDATNVIPARWSLAFDRLISVRKTADAREFLNDLASAKAVVTDSFHALMFSTIFGRNVRVIISPGRESMASRIKDFGRKIAMQNYMAEDVLPDIFGSRTTWNDSLLTKWIEDSKNWLCSALSGLV